MTNSQNDAAAQVRWGVYAMLIALAVGNMSGRILAVNSTDNARLEAHRIRERLTAFRQSVAAQGVSGEELERQVADKEAELQEALRLQRPFLSSNDRSRWMTVRSLVEHGTYEIDEIVGQPTWDSIDMVQHKGRDGQKHLYSSKPPLLATLVAGEYWLLHKITGKTLGTHPYELGRFMVFTVNVIPFAVMLILVAAMVERLGTTDFGRIFVMATAALGTLLTAFATVLNNHLPAAVSATITLYALFRIWHDGSTRSGWFAVAGFAAAFTAACELPALALFGLVGLWLVARWPRQTFLAFVPAAAVVAIAFFGTNYLAHDSFRPPYAHRSETDPEDNWYEFTFTVNGRERQSYWSDPQGIDRGEPSKQVYALHVLVGHHGIFSLTPVWLVSIAGCMMWLFARRRYSTTSTPSPPPPGRGRGPGGGGEGMEEWRNEGMEETRKAADHSALRTPGYPLGAALKWFDTRRMIAITTALLTIVCLVFYIGLSPRDRNYGGMTGGLRWMFWFAPLWLLVALPATDVCGRYRFGKYFCCLLLALSVVSVTFLTWNPWQQPWLAVFMEYMGWVQF
jgi:hypothetical protein